MKKKDTGQFLEIRNFIDSNLTKSISVAQLCHRFIINRTKLQSGFQELFQTSVYAYIVQRRMEQAADRIANSDEPIKSIALDSGYKRQRSFTKSFKSFFKEAPLVYRRKYQDNYPDFTKGS
jgi:AraC family transcriptional activator of pyochelin receptor